MTVATRAGLRAAVRAIRPRRRDRETLLLLAAAGALLVGWLSLATTRRAGSPSATRRSSWSI